MAPAWEQLAEEWADSATGMIAEVDCTEPTGQPLCEEYGVEGFPTLMYGDINAPEVSLAMLLRYLFFFVLGGLLIAKKI